MRMIVSKVDYSNDITIVTGVTEIGSIKGIWKFNEFPVIGKAYLIELGIGELNKNQVSIACKEALHPTVHLNEEFVSFLGMCEDIEDVYYIRFAKDWLEMIEIGDDDTCINKGDYVSFVQKYDLIWIYPY